MKLRSNCITLLVLLLIGAGWTVAAAERIKTPPQERSTTWGTYKFGADDSRRYEPVDIYPRYRYSHPSRYYLPPYYYYYPYYEREKRWYEGDLPIPAGRVMLLVEPLQAQVYVNGYPLQRQADLTYEAGLLKGEHQIEVTAQGYLAYRRTVQIHGSELIRLTIRLLEEDSPH